MHPDVPHSDRSGFDAVVIGAGVSGLSAACVLAAAGRRVVVLEQHTVAGGLLQRFRRRGIPFDTGFHYFGGAGVGGPLRPLLERLGVLGRIGLEPLDPDGFDEIVLPGRRVALPQGAARILARLEAEFPAETAGLRAWFDEVAALAATHAETAGRPGAGAAETALRSRSVTAALADLIRAPELKAVLAAHSMLYGVPANRAAMQAHAVVCASYYHSAHGIRGGGEALAEALVTRLRESGGELRVRTGVRHILTQDRKVVGVETDAGVVVRAPFVVSTAHPAVTLGLLGDAGVPERHRRLVAGLEDSPGAVLVHGVVRGVPPAAARRNHLWFERPDDAWDELRSWFAPGARPPRLVILPGPATPEAAGSTVFQVLCPARPDDLPEAARTGDARAWAAAKAGAASRVVPIVEHCRPDWAGRIEVIDVSTQRSVERFVRSPGGSCFGVACTVAQARTPKFAPSLGLRGLVVAGQSLTLPGVYGAIASAVAAADAAG